LTPKIAPLRPHNPNTGTYSKLPLTSLFSEEEATGPIFAAGYALATLDVTQTRWYAIITPLLTQRGDARPVFVAGYVLALLDVKETVRDY
jgi:hypothetical protein